LYCSLYNYCKHGPINITFCVWKEPIMILEYNQFDIPELTQKRNDQKKQYHDLKHTFLDLEKNFQKNLNEQQELEKKYALILKHIQTIKSENFSVLRKKSSINTAAQLLVDDIEKKENELKRLSIGKDELDSKNAQLRKQIQKLSSLNDIQKKVCAEASESIEILTNEKKELSEGISNRLSNISTEKDTIEEELNELNLQFMTSISKREEVVTAKESIQSTFQQLSETKEKDTIKLQELKHALKNSTEMKDLEQQYAALKKENDHQQSRWDSLKQKCQKQEKDLNQLNSQIEKKKQNSKKLEEIVRFFDTAITQYENEHQALNQSQALYQQYTLKLKNLPSEMEEIISFLMAVEDHDSLIEETFGKVLS